MVYKTVFQTMVHIDKNNNKYKKFNYVNDKKQLAKLIDLCIHAFTRLVYIKCRTLSFTYRR